MLISIFGVGLGARLREGLSGPEFFGDLVCGFWKLIGGNDFSFQFGEIIARCMRVGCGLNVVRRSACLDFGPVVVDGCAAIFGCAPVGRASCSLVART